MMSPEMKRTRRARTFVCTLTECRHAVDDVQIFEVLLELVLLMFGLVAAAIEQQRLFDQRTVVLGKNEQSSDKSIVHTHERVRRA